MAEPSDSSDVVGNLDTILHLIVPAAWQQAQLAGFITNDSLLTEGFIHCCTDEQLEGVLNRFYSDMPDILALRLRVADLKSPLRWEAPAHPDGTANTTSEDALKFPHVYGEIPPSAVVEEVPALSLIGGSNQSCG